MCLVDPIRLPNIYDSLKIKTLTAISINEVLFKEVKKRKRLVNKKEFGSDSIIFQGRRKLPLRW